MNSKEFIGIYGSFGFDTCQNLALATDSQYFALEDGHTCIFGNQTLSASSYIQYPDVQCSMRCGEYGDLVDGTLADTWTCGGLKKQSVYQLKV